MKALLAVIIGIILIGCVPARKYEELEAKQKECASELEKLKSQVNDVTTKNTELKAALEKQKEDLVELKADTSLLGKSLRMKEQQYDKINDLNNQLLAKMEKLQKGSQLENQKLTNDLMATKLELQKKEDELKQLEAELNKKQKDLALLSTELEAREQKVNELESIIASKDAKVKALKEKVAAALLGFKDKGLTVVQKDGKVYVSMEAKLLFPSGSTKIDSEGKKALIDLAKVLESQEDLEVLVEGHTDTDALKSSSHPKNNWELSVLRATSVVDIMLENSSMDKTKITAAGRGEFLPVDPNNKAKNRRIEIILIPNLDELFNIISSPEE